MAHSEYDAALRCLLRGYDENAHFAAHLSHVVADVCSGDAMNLCNMLNLLCKIASSFKTSLAGIPREVLTDHFVVHLQLRDLTNLRLCCKALNHGAQAPRAENT